jgi:hypothetical protein
MTVLALPPGLNNELHCLLPIGIPLVTPSYTGDTFEGFVSLHFALVL